MPKENQDIAIYTIVYTAADADRGRFHNPKTRGSYLPLASALVELERQIATEKVWLDSCYDCEERDGDAWEAYQDSCATACFPRIEALTDSLHCEGGS